MSQTHNEPTLDERLEIGMALDGMLASITGLMQIDRDLYEDQRLLMSPQTFVAELHHRGRRAAAAPWFVEHEPSEEGAFRRGLALGVAVEIARRATVEVFRDPDDAA